MNSILGNTALDSSQKVERMIADIIAPVLENDGGQIELIGFDAPSGEVSIRFIGSCANCPCSMLSLENIVKPPLLRIDGVTRVVHRGIVKAREAPAKIAVRQIGP